MVDREEPDITRQDESTIDSIWDEIVTAGGIDIWVEKQPSEGE